MRLRIWDVQHGACAMVQHVIGNFGGRLAMIDSGSAKDWWPSDYIKQELGRDKLDYTTTSIATTRSPITQVKIRDPKVFESLKGGGNIDLTYAEGLAVNVTAASKK